MGNIIMGDRRFSFSEIRNRQWQGLKPYFDGSMQFCQDWLKGVKSFELKTSGSTGQQKTIQVQRSQMQSSARATAECFVVKNSINMLCCIHTGMIAGKMMLVRAMEWDSDLYLVTPSSNPFLHVSPNLCLDFVALVPYQLEISFEDRKSKRLLHQVKNLILGGAQISTPLQDKARQLSG